MGLEIKRGFTVGHLSGWRSAALPVAGALGGMVAPAALYLLIVSTGPWSHGWGVPMSTDTAFAVALIVLTGARVLVELRIFLTAAAIVDDLGTILRSPSSTQASSTSSISRRRPSSSAC